MPRDRRRSETPSPADAGFARAARALPLSTVVLEVANLTGNRDAQVGVELQWLGETRFVQLVDDGSVLGDVPDDNIYTGRVDGEAVRILPLRILVATGGRAPEEAWSGMESIDGVDARLVYELVREAEHIHAERVPAPWFGQPRASGESERIVINAVWMALVILIVAALSRPLRSPTPPLRPPRGGAAPGTDG